MNISRERILETLERGWAGYVTTYDEWSPEVQAEFLPGVLHLAIRFNACFDTDPLLPPELLPRPWPGKEARELLARCRRLGVLAREDKDGPALYRVFDDAIAHLP